MPKLVLTLQIAYSAEDVALAPKFTTPSGSPSARPTRPSKRHTEIAPHHQVLETAALNLPVRYLRTVQRIVRC